MVLHKGIKLTEPLERRLEVVPADDKTPSDTFPTVASIRSAPPESEKPPISRWSRVLSRLSLPEPLPSVSAEPAVPAKSDELRVSRWTRLFSLLALTLVLVALFQICLTAYRAMRDSFVAPIIFSPESESVAASRMNLSHLVAERRAAQGRIGEAESAIRVAEGSIAKLTALQELINRALGWSEASSNDATLVAEGEVSTLAEQRKLLDRTIADQAEYVSSLEKELNAGLVRENDVVRERAMLSQLRVASLQNKRERSAAEMSLRQGRLVQGAIRSPNAASMLTPEMIQQRDHLIRVEIDLLGLEAEKMTKEASLIVAKEDAAKLDELIGQMKQLPVFRAIDKQQNVAFVPYTQLDRVVPGAEIRECGLWGVLGCKKVGEVVELLPGEVAMADPWGVPTRGQYAVMRLNDAGSAKAKVLRVRMTQPTTSAAP